MNEQGKGRTTAQMRNAPEGAIYLVGAYQEIPYARALAHHLLRSDLRIEPFDWLRHGQWRGFRGAVILDHAAPERMTDLDRQLWSHTPWGRVS